MVRKCKNCKEYATFYEQYGRWWMDDDCKCGEFEFDTEEVELEDD